MNLNLLPYL